MARPLREQGTGVAMEAHVRVVVGRLAWLGATGGHERGSLGRGEECGFLDLVDRALLVAVLDPAGAAVGADGGRVQTEGDGDQGRSAQRAAWHQNPSPV